MHGYYASKLMISKIVKHIEILHTFRLAMSYLAGRSNRAAANRRSHWTFINFQNCTVIVSLLNGKFLFYVPGHQAKLTLVSP